MRAGRLNPRGIIITHRVPLEEVNDAYHMFSAKQDECIKALLIPPRAGAVKPRVEPRAANAAPTTLH